MARISFNRTSQSYVAEDAFLSRDLACGFADGLCTDASMDSGNDIRFMGSHKTLGLSVVDFRRTFPPGDPHDAPIAMDGPTQVIVAIGSAANRMMAGGGGSVRHGGRRRGPGGPRGGANSMGLNLELENTTIDFSSEEVGLFVPKHFFTSELILHYTTIP